jgi:uncharacterized protein YjbI with pentapeptide repeats
MSPEQLTQRWLTPAGARLRSLVIEGSQDTSQWETLLDNFPGAADLPESIDLRGIDLTDQHLERADLGGLALDFGRFDHCRLAGADFQMSSLNHASFQAAALTQAHLWWTNASGACFDEAVLSHCSLRDGKFAGATFRRALLDGADMSNSDCTGAAFTAANLRGAIFDGARLWKADFAGADLTGASFRGAHHEEPPAPPPAAGRPLSELEEFYALWVVPFYARFLHGNAMGHDSVLSNRFRKRVCAILDSADAAILDRLLSIEDWRPRLVASWLCGLKRWPQYGDRLGKELLASRACFAGQGYCFALARFADAASTDYLCRYLDVYLPQIEKYYDQHWALPALMWIDSTRGSNLAAKFVGAGSLWARFAEGQRRDPVRFLDDRWRHFAAIMTSSAHWFG